LCLPVSDVCNNANCEWTAIVFLERQPREDHFARRDLVKIIGTQPETIDWAEDRDRFRHVIGKLGIPQPESGMASTLEEAIADCALVVGASARLRTISWPTLDPKACAERMIDVAETDQVALVMGRERTGLTNAELEHCHYLVHIPANPDYTSLNVAAATQVLVYELRMAALAKGKVLDSQWRSDHPFATNEELEGLYAHFETALTQLGFLDPDNPRQLMRRLRRLFNRSQLDRMEVNILRGILATAEKGGKGKAQD
jgi:TrmH family RNA methyltransferase